MPQLANEEKILDAIFNHASITLDDPYSNVKITGDKDTFNITTYTLVEILLKELKRCKEGDNERQESKFPD